MYGVRWLSPQDSRRWSCRSRTAVRAMTQTVKGSAWEAATNVLVGFGVNFAMNLLLLPLFGFATLTVEKNLFIGALYTGVSLVRSFVLRRIFTRIKSQHT
jgi:hypothetical protein